MALTQSGYRFGINELAESTHGWLANLNTAISRDYTNLTTFLCRVLLQCDASASNNAAPTWQYSLNGGAFTAITTTSSVVKAVTPSCWADGASTTSRLGGSGTFDSTNAGCTADGIAGGTTMDIAANGNNESEIGLQLVAGLASGDTVDLRVLDGSTVLTYTQTPRINITGPVASSRSVNDGLFVPDARTSGRLSRPPIDRVLLGDSATATKSGPAAVEIGAINWIADYTAAVGGTVNVTDGLLMPDARVAAREMSMRDAPLLSDARAGLLAKLIAEAPILLGEASVRTSDRGRVALDAPLLGEQRQSSLSKAPLIDRLLLGDVATAQKVGRVVAQAALDQVLLASRIVLARALSQVETVLLGDIRAQAIGRFALDKSLLGDTVARSLARVLTDLPLLGDTRVSLLARLTAEGLLLGDVATAQKFGGAVLNQRSATDFMLLADAKLRARLLARVDVALLGETRTAASSKAAADALMLGELAQRVLQASKTDGVLLADTWALLGRLSLTRTDRLLLGDTVSTVKGAISFRTAIDNLLLADQIAMLLRGSRRATDSVLLGDAAARDIRSTRLDKILLGDVRTSSVERTRLATDGLLLRETQVMARRMAVLEALLLGELLIIGGARKVELALLDQMLLADARSSDIGRAFLDQALVAEARTLARTLALFDGLSLSEERLLRQRLMRIFSDATLLNEAAAIHKALAVVPPWLIRSRTTLRGALGSVKSTIRKARPPNE